MSTVATVEPDTPPRSGGRVVIGDRAWSLTSGDELIIGRDSAADIRIDHPEASRRHATICSGTDGAWVVRDLGSANGVYVAGERITTAPLRPGTQVRFGPAADAPVLVYEASGASQEAVSVVAGASAPTLTIGRATDNDVVVDDLLASRRHARAVRRGRGFWIEDLGSLNGTHVNGRLIAAEEIGPGDLLTIGHLEFRVVDGELRMAPQQREVSLAAHDLRVVLPGGKELLGGVDIELPAASLLAVIGPSGAGKSTLLGALTGSRRATSGTVTFDGRDLYENFSELRHRIGLVPQDDVVHPQLTVRQALEYASRLRFPADLDDRARRNRIDQVLAELELTSHVDTRIDKLSGGQRKRTSVALELLTEPSLLFLDEPTSGLDPGLDKSVMSTLRALADTGRTVVVVTHSVANLGLCDRVLLLAPGGKVAYYGPPQQVLGYFGREDYADVFTDVAAHPEEVAQSFRRYAAASPAPAPAAVPVRSARPAAPPLRQQSVPSQVATLARRHLRVLLADRSYALFMLLMPFVLGLLVGAVPGGDGFGARSDPESTEPRQLLVVLIVGAAFMGIASSARDLVGERAIYRREKGVGLSPVGYLAAKLLVFGGLAVLQSAVLVGLALALKTPPDAHVLGHGGLELYAATVATTFVSATTGLLISAWVSTSEQVMPLLVVGIMGQLVLCGGLITLKDQKVLEVLAWVAPSRWGFAAAAASIDLPGKLGALGERDDLWKHTTEAWWWALAVLGLIALGAVLLTGLRLARVGKER